MIAIEGGGTAVAVTSVTGPFPIGVPVPVSFALSIKTDASDSVKDVMVEWGDGQMAELGALTQVVASHAYATAGTFVLTTNVETTAGRQASVPIRLTVGS
jgi:hypothetical protein